MGQELEGKLRYQGRTAVGKVQLETDFVLFRGGERLKILLKDLTGVKASGGVLVLEFAGGPAELELGAAAEKWAKKILHPPSRMDKLGVKAGTAVRLVGEFEPGFLEELRERKSEVVPRGPAGLVFLAASRRRDLEKIAKLKAAEGLWVVYPKGVEEIREIEVIEAGRAAGLKDVKVARFSDTHTGLKFV
jgi:hypothetical protein